MANSVISHTVIQSGTTLTCTRQTGSTSISVLCTRWSHLRVNPKISRLTGSKFVKPPMTKKFQLIYRIYRKPPVPTHWRLSGPYKAHSPTYQHVMLFPISFQFTCCFRFQFTQNMRFESVYWITCNTTFKQWISSVYYSVTKCKCKFSDIQPRSSFK